MTQADTSRDLAAQALNASGAPACSADSTHVAGPHAERLENLSFDPEAVESERNVIISERRTRVDNNNLSQLLEQMRATAYVAHPYQFPVIGWPSDIAAWTSDDLENFYRTYYAPNNITMLVVGDVTPEEVLDLAEDYLAGIPAQDPPAEVRTVEPEQTGERRLVSRCCSSETLPTERIRCRCESDSRMAIPAES